MRERIAPPYDLDPEERAMLEEDLACAQAMWARARRSGSPSERGNALIYLASLIADLEGPQRALRHNRRALWHYRKGDNSVDIAEARGILLEAGHEAEGLRCSHLAQEEFRAIEPENRPDWIANRLAGLILRAGHLGEGRAWLDLALMGPFSVDHGALLEDLARLLPAKEAQGWQFKACEAYHRATFFVDEARGMVTLARYELQLGNRWRAEELCREALAMAQSLESEGLAYPGGIRRLVQRLRPKEARSRLLSVGRSQMRCH